ncbi:protein of unknown function [Pararobbsia alpina]
MLVLFSMNLKFFRFTEHQNHLVHRVTHLNTHLTTPLTPQLRP